MPPARLPRGCRAPVAGAKRGVEGVVTVLGPSLREVVSIPAAVSARLSPKDTRFSEQTRASNHCFANYSAYFAYRMASILCIFCILFCIFDAYYFAFSYAYSAYCAYSTYCTLHIVHIVHILDEKSLSPGFHCLLPLLLGPPSQGPAVHVPPPTTITTVC